MLSPYLYPWLIGLTILHDWHLGQAVALREQLRQLQGFYEGGGIEM